MTWTALIAVLLGIPLAFIAGLLVADERLEGVTIDPSPVVIPVSVESFTDEQRIRLRMRWNKGGSISAPSWSGIVTRVHVRRGESLTNGDRILAVDGIDRIAGTTEQPFYRELRLGDEGSDVEALHSVLAALGFLETAPQDPSSVGSETVEAVSDLAQSLGVARRTRIFDHSWVIWIPREGFEVGRIHARLGSPAPSVGETLISGAPHLVKAVATNQDGGALALDPSVPYTIHLGNLQIDLRRGSAQIGSTDLVRLARAVSSSTKTKDGVLTRRKPLKALAVPSAAVMSGRNSRLCVWVPNGSGYSAVFVDPVDAQGSLTRLATANPAPTEILANPFEILENPGCPSNSAE